MSLQVEKKGGSIRHIFNANDDTIKGDITHIMNVVLNLIDNAIKYSLEGPEITIRTEIVSHQFQLSVQDRGVGMSREAQKNIFQRFYRVHTGNLHDVKGFGLGLSYVKGVLQEHNGSISVDSELGKGSKFQVTLPLLWQKNQEYYL